MESAASNKRSFLRAERASAPENLRDLWAKENSFRLSVAERFYHSAENNAARLLMSNSRTAPEIFLSLISTTIFLFKVNHVPSPLRVHLQGLLFGGALRRYSRRRGPLLQHGPARLVYDPGLLHSWALFLFFFLVGVFNALYKCAFPSGGLARAELLLIYSMMLIASAITTCGLSEYLLPIMGSWLYFATPENRWDDLFHPTSATSWSPTTRAPSSTSTRACPRARPSPGTLGCSPCSGGASSLSPSISP